MIDTLVVLRPEVAVFVPAVMGAGLVYWLVVLVRESLDRHVERLRTHRRTGALAAATAATVLGQSGAAGELRYGLPSRRTTAWAAAVLLGVAAYLVPGALLNYLRPGGYVAEIAWILVMAVLGVVVFGYAGTALAAAALRADSPPAWVRPLLLALPLLRSDEDAIRLHPIRSEQASDTGGSRSLRRTAVSLALIVVAVAIALLTLAVAMQNDAIFEMDAALGEWARAVGPHLVFSLADRLGTTGLAVFWSLAYVALLRRRAPRLAVAYPIAVALGLASNVFMKVVVARPRPIEPLVGTALASFPSGHTIQAVLFAGFTTAAVHALVRRKWVTVVAGTLAGLGALLAGGARVVFGAHWPTDVLGGFLFAGFAALTAILATGAGIGPRGADATAVFVLPDRLVRFARPAARISAVAVVCGFFLLAWIVGVPKNPEGLTRGTDIEAVVQSALLVFAAAATLISWRWEAVGATAFAIVATLLAVFAAVEYTPGVALLVSGAFLVPAALFWLSWQRQRTVRSLVSLAVVAAVLVAATWAGATTVYDHYFGPSHPESSTVLPRSSHLEWVWAGALTSSSFSVNAKVGADGTVRLLVSEEPALGDPVRVVIGPRAERGDVVSLTVDGLEPGRTYHYALEVGEEVDLTRIGRINTPPVGPASFIVTFGACARTGSNGAVFDAIAALDPMLHLITGDMHYGNVSADDAALLEATLDRTLMAHAQQALHLQAPVAYIWDDHDYGGNDSDRYAPIRATAQRTYRTYVPHHALPSTEGIHHAFSLGRVRFILTDTRSYRSATPDGEGTMLGPEQLAWFERELVEASRSHAVVVWVSPTPWIGPDAPGSDAWAGFPVERRRLADLIDRSGIDNLIMIAGDAHMVAIDDGTNSGYATSGAPGFPVAHGAALDRPGSVKGGPYSEGAFPGAGQFGVIEIYDDGHHVRVELSGHTWEGTELVRHSVTFESRDP
jgi:membrane-associated phospholipid phosphatase